MAIQGLINMGIGIKKFKWVLEGLDSAEAITASLVAWDFGILFGILFFFMFLASGGQVRGDVRLGRLTQKQFRSSKVGHIAVPVIAVGVILTTVMVMTAVGLIMQVILAAAGLVDFSVETAVAFKTVSAMLGSLAGCGAGAWWGRRQESALMAGGESA